MITHRTKQIGFLLAVLLLTAGAVYAVNAALTFSSTSVVSEGALTLTGAGASTWDIGANTLSLQTVGNGAITTGSGLFTVAGAATIQGNTTMNGRLGIGQSTAGALLHIGAGSGNTGHIRMDGINGNPGTVTAGDMWYNTSQKSLRVATAAGTMGLSGLLAVTTSNSSAINNTTSETNFDQSFTLPANALTVGKRLKIRASGYFSTTSGNSSCNANPAGNCITLKMKYGSTTLFSTGGASSLSGSMTNEPWFLEGYITVRSVGATGTVIASGSTLFSGTSGSSSPLIGGNASVVTIDTTAATALQLSAQWNVANASNTITMQDFAVEVMD